MAVSDAVQQNDASSVQQNTKSNENVQNFTQDAVRQTADPTTWSSQPLEENVNSVETAGKANLYQDCALPASMSGGTAGEAATKAPTDGGMAATTASATDILNNLGVNSLPEMNAAGASGAMPDQASVIPSEQSMSMADYGKVLSDVGSLLQDSSKLFSDIGSSGGTMTQQEQQLLQSGLQMDQSVLNFASDLTKNMENQLEPPTANPSNPMSPTNPAIPTAPENPTSPTTPDNPTIPSAPDNPITPTTPDNPTIPSTPDNPTTPTTPDNPTVPSTPDNPTTPTAPDNPTVPTTPDNPTTPTTPDNPTVPSTPDNPTTPTTPDNPTDPTTPDNPTTPTTPDNPTDPTTPDNPTTPNTPDNPITPTTPPTDQTGLYVQGNQLMDNGKPFIMAGINDTESTEHDELTGSMGQLAADGANTVRLMGQASDLEGGPNNAFNQEVQAALNAGLKVDLSFNTDTAIYGQTGGVMTDSDVQEGAQALQAAATEWGNNPNVMYNVVNEQGAQGDANNQQLLQNTTTLEQAVVKGAQSANPNAKPVIIVDDSEWGQGAYDPNYQGQSFIYNNAQALEAAGNGNVVAAIHNYDTSNSYNDSGLEAIQNEGMPVINEEIGYNQHSFQIAEQTSSATGEPFGGLVWVDGTDPNTGSFYNNIMNDQNLAPSVIQFWQTVDSEAGSASDANA